jgi:hypothetical protein
MSEELKTIEINGVKFEVDLREAKQINTLRVGDRCRVLVKNDYGDDKVHAGVVIGFEPFQSRPTVIVVYVDGSYNRDMKFAYINATSKNYELIKSVDDDAKALDKEDVLRSFDRDIATKQREIADLEEKRSYFLRKFATCWEPVATQDADEEVATH